MTLSGLTQMSNMFIGMNDSGEHSGFNKILLILFSTVFTYMAQYILDHHHAVAHCLKNLKSTLYIYLAKKINLQMILTEMDAECYVKASDSVRAVIYYIEKNIKGYDDITNLREMFTSTFFCYSREGSDKNSTQFVLDQERLVHLQPGIWCSITIDKEVIEERTKYYINVTLLSMKSVKIIREFIDLCMTIYKNDMQKQLHKQKYIFMLNSTKEGSLNYTELEFCSNKTFDNMFFTGKKEFVQRIDYFMNNRHNYDAVGMPYTLGLLLSGPPGTGKSSCIKGLANYMDRHIIIIPTNLVTNKNTLVDIFCETKINNKIIPMEKRLYVIEELDCGSWKHIVADRTAMDISDKKNNTNVNHQSGDNQMIDLLLARTISMARPENSDFPSHPVANTLTLADILEVLDGLMETPGRVIVFTSNHPDKLDQALLRPGRINMMFEFKHLTKCDISDMYKLWFNKPIPQYICEKMKDGVFTQAQIGEIFISHGNNKEKLWKILTAADGL